MSVENGSGKGNGEIFEKLTTLKTWEDFFTKTPCVKSSYLWGVGCGGLMFAHKTRLYRGKIGHALNASIFTFLAVSSMSFMMCTSELNRKFQTVRQAMELQKIQQAPKDTRSSEE